MPWKAVYNSYHRLTRRGQGIYTAGDFEKGSNLTPSQLARGVDTDNAADRWWLLSQSQRQSWTDASANGLTGRRLYNTVNRLRLDLFQPTSDIPPATSEFPGSIVITSASATLYAGTPNEVFFQFTYDGTAPQFYFEYSLYVPRVPPTGEITSAARWAFVNWDDAYGSAGQLGGSSFGGGFRGPDSTPFTPPLPTLGETIRMRVLPCSSEYYPGQPVYLTATVTAAP